MQGLKEPSLPAIKEQETRLKCAQQDSRHGATDPTAQGPPGTLVLVH